MFAKRGRKLPHFVSSHKQGLAEWSASGFSFHFRNAPTETLVFQRFDSNIQGMQRGEHNPVPLVLFGVPFHNVTFEEAVEWVVDRVQSGRPASIATANLDFLTHAWRDPELQRLLIDADLVLADGFPIVKLSPRYGPRLKERVTGSDMAPLLARRAATEGFRVFGLGGAEGVAEKALKILQERHPELKVAGACSPEFASVLEMNHERILKQIHHAKPDILFVAMGAPKQDKFIHMHVHNWDVPVAIGVGGALDFISGAQIRAPKWMQRINLEWFWRMMGHPFRLFPRYFMDFCFILRAGKQIRKIQKGKDRESMCQLISSTEEDRLEALKISMSQFHPINDEADAQEFVRKMEALSECGCILLDTAAPYWLSSLELGALLQASRTCRAKGGRLILYGPRPNVFELLKICRLTDYFNVAYCMDDVEYLVRHLAKESGVETYCSEQLLAVDLPVELTAATLPGFEPKMEQVYAALQKRRGIKRVTIDASHLDFIDSSGLGMLIALKKATSEKHITLLFKGISPVVKQIFEVANVDRLLLKT